MLARILEDTGGEGTALVYVPGVDGTGEFLFETAKVLAARFRLIRLSYECEAVESCSQAGYAGLAASIASGLAQRGIVRPILLAESFGVGVALRVALDHPGRVGALALVNGFARYDRRVRIRLAAGLGSLVPPFLFDWGRRFAVPRFLFGRQRTPAVSRAFLSLPGGRFDRGYRCRLRMIAELDLRQELPELRLPVSLFASDKDWIVRSVAAARGMAELIPGAELELLEGAGHATLPFEGERWRERLQALADRRARC